jgi:hypothetical protein
VKGKVHQQVGLTPAEQQLFFAGELLSDNSKSLLDYKIPNRSTLYIDENDNKAGSENEMKSRLLLDTGIRTLVLDTLDLSSSSSGGSTVADLKMQVQEHEGRPCGEQRLVFRSALLANDSRTLASYDVRSDSIVKLEEQEDTFRIEARIGALATRQDPLRNAIKRIGKEFRNIQGSMEGQPEASAGVDRIFHETNHLLRETEEVNIRSLETKCNDLHDAGRDIDRALEQTQKTLPDLPRAVANTQLCALEVKFQEYVGDIEQVAAGLEKIRHATVRLAMEATNSSLAVEIDRLRELERVIENRRSSVADKIPVEPSDAAKAELDRMATENDRLMVELERVTSQASLRSNDVAAGTDSKELELEVENLKEEIEALHAEIERLQQLLRSQNEETQILEDALNIASGSASSVATPRKGTPEETQVQLSPRAPGKRGFMVDWERNNGMDPLVRLREARLSVQNLEPADLQKPKGAALLYLEAALKRAAILTTSPGEDAQSTPDPWSCPLHDAISAVEPKEAINIASESIALAKKVDIVKDDATMSSEYSNIAETIENWNQALMNEAELAKVVEEINQSRREVLEIRRGNIDEIRSNNHPTPMVEDILLAVMTTMNDASRKGGWKSIKKRMAKGLFSSSQSLNATSLLSFVITFGKTLIFSCHHSCTWARSQKMCMCVCACVTCID